MEVHEVREMGLYEEGESEGFPGLRMGIIVDCFQADGKVCVLTKKGWRCIEESLTQIVVGGIEEGR